MTRCELFESISSATWDLIARNNYRHNRLNEEGITRQTVINAIHNYVEDNRRFDVFAQKARNEVNTGADLELFIQNPLGSFSRILLQAKIMETNNTFENLNRNSGSTGRKQYDTLINCAYRLGAKSYYLLFNGIYNYRTTGKDCAGSFNEKQFGCAVLEANQIKNHCEMNNTGRLGDINNPQPKGNPWRFLSCCIQDDWRLLNSYSFEDIDKDSHFDKIFNESGLTSFLRQDDFQRRSNVELNNNYVHNSGWNPCARIFITTNDNKMMKENNLLTTI